MSSSQPRTLPHTFTLAPLRAHFAKAPNPPGANRLIDMPGDVFIDTDDEMHLVAGALYVLAVQWDKLDEGKRPKDRAHMRAYREPVLKSLGRHIEPPFHAETFNTVERDVGALLHELFEQTLPPDNKHVDGSGAKDGKDKNERGKGEGGAAAADKAKGGKGDEKVK